MYRLNDIVEAFKPLVGWKWDASENNPDIENPAGEEITRSESGLYFQEAHPLLTLRAMRSIMPNGMEKKYPEWTYGYAGYKRGDIASHNKKAWWCTVDGAQETPGDGMQWIEYPLLVDYLNEVEERGIKNVIKRFVTERKHDLELRNLIDRRAFFDGMGRSGARVQNTGKLVGFEFVPLKSEATMKIEKIGLQFIGNQGDVTVYLFHTSSSEPIWSETFSFTAKNGSMQWFEIPEGIVLPYLKNGVEGTFYICYNQPDLPDFMEAINFQRDWSKEPCSSCNKGDARLWKSINRFVQVSPFVVSNFDGNLWSAEDVIYTPMNNYGLNFLISLECDATESIIKQKEDFAIAIQLQVASDALRALALNPDVKVNRVQYNADRNDILYETDGNGEGIKGLRGELERAYASLSFKKEGIAPYCLICKQKGIRIGSI